MVHLRATRSDCRVSLDRGEKSHVLPANSFKTTASCQFYNRNAVEMAPRVKCTDVGLRHFRKQHGVDERTLEMLSQARAISFDATATPLEAVLLETDEIRRHPPPYNVALTIDDRAVWFASPDLSERSPRPSQACPHGPLVSVETLDQFAALAR